MNENETNKRYIVTLSIAGSDSSGGAGIQADIKTMSALGCFAATAITSITVQNTLGVTDIQDIEPRIVAGQIRAVMDDIHPAAIKIGMVSDSRTICAIAETLHSYDNLPSIIIDPELDLAIVILTNKVHRTTSEHIVELRSRVATLVGAAIVE